MRLSKAKRDPTHRRTNAGFRYYLAEIESTAETGRNRNQNFGPSLPTDRYFPWNINFI